VSGEGGTLGRKGCLLIVSGPSGAGKTSIAQPVLAALDRISMSISLTTRKPRAGETDGVDYHFITEEEFDRRTAAGEFAEWALVHGCRYGTSRATIDRAIEQGNDLLLDIDVQGAEQIKKAYPDAVSVFLLPPSREHLEGRLRGRGTDDESTVQRRLEAACREISSMAGYDYVIVNEYLPAAVEQFLTIVRAERCKVERLRQDDLSRLLTSYGVDR